AQGPHLSLPFPLPLRLLHFVSIRASARPPPLPTLPLAPTVHLCYQTLPLRIFIPCVNGQRGKVFLGNRLDKEAGLLDFGEERHIMIYGVTSHSVIIVNFFFNKLVYNIDSQIDLVV